MQGAAYEEAVVVDVCVQGIHFAQASQSSVIWWSLSSFTGALWGFRALLKGTSVVVMRENKCRSVTFPAVLHPASGGFEPVTTGHKPAFASS